MEAIVLIGIQGSGKSTFYSQRFASTHARISLDELKTRRREQEVLEAYLRLGRPFVIDNTNVRAADRARYIAAAKAAGFRVTGYFLDASLRDALRRNKLRAGKEAIPVPGVVGTLKRLERPSFQEGFDELYSVSRDDDDQFVVTPFAEGAAARGRN